MTEHAPFSTRTLGWLYGVGLLSFCVAVYLALFGAELEPGTTAGTNAYSKSAIGHGGLVEFLRRLENPVVVSRHDSARKAAGSNLLVVSQPFTSRHRPMAGARTHEDSSSRDSDESTPATGGSGKSFGGLEEMMRVPNVLLVLPKWRGQPQIARPRWISVATPLPTAQVDQVLAVVDLPSASVVRGVTPVWAANDWGLQPSLKDPQLLRSHYLRPLISSDQGVLLGQLRNRNNRVWVLSDPDLLSNHGLGQGDNASLAMGIISELLQARGGAVIFDETVHGFEGAPSIWRALFEFPLALVTAQLLFAMVILLWASTGRFGAPIPPAPPLKAGKRELIDNTADLLEFGGHRKQMLRRYRDAIVKGAATQMHAPKSLDGATLIHWLDQIGEVRGVPISLSELNREIDAALSHDTEPTHLVRLAHRLGQWKREITHGG